MGMSKYDRMLNILNLLRSRKNLNAAALAQECGVTERSIYRDIIALSEANVPIYYDHGYKLASDNFLPPLNFTYDEYHALQLALESSPLNRISKYSEILHRIRAKVDSNLPASVREKKRTAVQTTRIELGAAEKRSKAERFFGVIEEAVASNRCIEVEYDSITSGISTRVIEPYFVVFRGRAFYVVAYCRLRQDFRTFRIDQVLRVRLLEDSFVPRKDISAESYFDGSWQVFSGEPIEVEVRFSGTAARIVASRSHHPNERVECLAGGDVLYRITVRGGEEIQRWILAFGEEAVIISPEELRCNLYWIGSYLVGAYANMAGRTKGH